MQRRVGVKLNHPPGSSPDESGGRCRSLPSVASEVCDVDRFMTAEAATPGSVEGEARMMFGSEPIPPDPAFSRPADQNFAGGLAVTWETTCAAPDCSESIICGCTLTRLFRWLRRGFIDPAGLDPRLDDHGPAFLAGQPEPSEHARVGRGRVAHGLDPAVEIVNGASGELFQRFDAILAQGDQHRGGDARNFFERILDAERSAPGFELGFAGRGLVTRSRLQSLRGFGSASQPGEHVPPISLSLRSHRPRRGSAGGLSAMPPLRTTQSQGGPSA